MSAWDRRSAGRAEPRLRCRSGEAGRQKCNANGGGERHGVAGRACGQTRCVESSSIVRVRVIVEGRVQGVFYRDSCCREARRLGVRGSVRNRADRSVEVVAEGPRDRVDQLLDWCRHGPPSAVVSKVSVTDEPPRAEREFRIDYG